MRVTTSSFSKFESEFVFGIDHYDLESDCKSYVDVDETRIVQAGTCECCARYCQSQFCSIECLMITRESDMDN